MSEVSPNRLYFHIYEIAISFTSIAINVALQWQNSAIKDQKRKHCYFSIEK